jgi:hypothetical protein
MILDRQRVDSKMLKRFQEQVQQNFGGNENRLDFQSGKLAVYDFIQRVFTNNGKDNGHLIYAGYVYDRLRVRRRRKDRSG